MPDNLITIIVAAVVALVIGLLVGIPLGKSIRRKFAEKEIGSAELQAKKIIADGMNQAKAEAAAAKKEALIEAKEEMLTYAEHRPDILSLKRAMESKKHLIAAAKGAASPTFSLTGAYSSYFSSTAEGSFGKQLESNVNPSVGISVNIPLFDGFAGVQRIRDSKIEFEKAGILVEKQLSELSATIQGAFIESENLYQAMLAAKEKMTSAEKLMDISLSKFKHGNITAIEYTVSRTDFLSAQSEYLRCKWQYIFQLKIIDFYRGIPIEL